MNHLFIMRNLHHPVKRMYFIDEKKSVEMQKYMFKSTEVIQLKSSNIWPDFLRVDATGKAQDN